MGPKAILAEHAASWRRLRHLSRIEMPSGPSKPVLELASRRRVSLYAGFRGLSNTGGDFGKRDEERPREGSIIPLSEVPVRPEFLVFFDQRSRLDQRLSGQRRAA